MLVAVHQRVLDASPQVGADLGDGRLVCKAGHLRNENLSDFWSYVDRAQLLLTDSVAQPAAYTEACILPTDRMVTLDAVPADTDPGRTGSSEPMAHRQNPGPAQPTSLTTQPARDLRQYH
ncbi:hypothetical protein [Kitasatospora sp. NPDC001095]